MPENNRYPTVPGLGGIGLPREYIVSRLGSIAHLFSGTLAVTGLMALSTIVAARALGPQMYGVLALVLTMGRICERLIRFESWQPLIRFASQPEAEADPAHMGRLFVLGLMLDLACAAAAALALVAAGYLLLPLVGLDQSQYYLLLIFAPAIAFNIRGVPTAALRLAGHFRTLAYFQTLSAVLRLTLAVAAWAWGAGVAEFLAIWTFAQLVDTAIFAWLARRSLNSIGVELVFDTPPAQLIRAFPGFMGFAWSTNASSTLRTLTQEADVLLVGAMTGTAGAGLYHLAKRLAKMAQQVGQHIQAVLYPDFARLWAQGQVRMFGTIVMKVQAILAGFAVLALGAVWLFGDPLIALLLGEDYAGLLPLVFTQVIAVALILHASTPRSAMLAMNHPGTVLMIALVSTAIFFGVASVAIPAYGPIGANFAHIAFALFTALALDASCWPRIWRRQRHVEGGNE